MHKKLGVGFLFLLFALTLFIPFTSAESVLDKLVGTEITLPGVDVEGLFSSLQSTGFAQFLFFILIFLVLYSISPFLPFISDKNWIGVLVSLVVALLAVLFLKDTEINTILLSYGALGIVLTAIIPFFAIAVIAKHSYDKGFPILSKVIWLAFAVVLFVRWITADVNEIGAFGTLVFPLVVILSVIMLIAERWIYFKMFGLAMRGEVDQARMAYVRELQARLEVANERLAAAKTPEAIKGAKAEVTRLEKQLHDSTKVIDLK